MRFRKIGLFLCLLSVCSTSVFADRDKASAALADILFDMEVENISYEVEHNGGVVISFGIAVPEKLFVEVTSRLRAHDDINGVLSTYGTGNYCPQP